MYGLSPKDIVEYANMSKLLCLSHVLTFTLVKYIYEGYTGKFYVWDVISTGSRDESPVCVTQLVVNSKSTHLR